MDSEAANAPDFAAIAAVPVELAVSLAARFIGNPGHNNILF
jgi:hypothetical protein